MKKRITMMSMAVALCLMAVIVLTACGGGGGAGAIAVVSRDAVSGSRQSFDYNVRIGAHTSLTRWQETKGNRIPGDQFNSQAGVVNAVAGNPNAIGYASLSGVENNTAVKMLNIDGKAPGEAGYRPEFVRDFVILVPTGVTLFGRTQQFYNFLQSSQAKTATETFGLDFGTEIGSTAYVPAADPGQTGNAKIQIRGSTTVTPLMEHLIATFVALVPWATQDMFDLNAGGSGQGVNVGRQEAISTAPYTVGAAIGMSSNKGHGIPANGDTFELASDITAVIVHKDNAVTNLTVAELYAIYTGTIKNWSAFAAAAA